MSKKSIAVHFSSKAQDWATPKWLFDKINAKHGPLWVDVAADLKNHKCPLWIGGKLDSFRMSWYKGWDYPGIEECPERPTCWLNPPYGRSIGKWMEKAFIESKQGCKVVCLVPARTDTKWWHHWVLQADVIEFLVGRIKFDGGNYTAPFPSAVVVYDPAAANSHLHYAPTISWVDYRT